MAWEISWADMCRACMEVEGDLLSLFSENEAEDENLAERLAEMGLIEISKNDGLPTKLCAKCISKMAKFFEFRNLIQESDSKLRFMFNQQVVSDTDVDKINDQIQLQESCLIKNEIIDTCDDSIKDEQVILEIMKEDDSESLSETNPINGCDTIVLRVEGDLDNGSEIHLVLESANLAEVRDGDKPTENNIDPELEQYFNLSSEALKFENGDFVTYKSQQALPKSGDDSIKKDEKSQFGENDNSDSDGFENPLEDIVGSLNDEITKVKEILVNGRVTEFQCTLCNQNYKELADAVSHVVDLHVPNSGPFYCLVCEKDCDNLKQLKTHVKIHKWPQPYICFLCQKAYVMKRYLKRHMACHTDFPRHRCPKCGIRFKVKDELDEHMAEHKETQIFKCDQCTRVFNHKGNYKRHLISHLDPRGILLPKFPCTICNRRFLNNRSLTVHTRSHTGEKPYKCDVCGKRFSQHGNLINHERIHSNPRNFVCETCGKKFNQKATLRDHSLIHSGEKPHVCNVCGLAFTFSAALRRHLWSHSDGKPYECNVCKAKFIGKYELKRHMDSHGRPNKSTQNKIKRGKKKIVAEFSEQQAVDIIGDNNDTNTIFVEQIFLNEETLRIESEHNPEKENVDSILGLIQYT